jgi:hypothetical protein
MGQLTQTFSKIQHDFDSVEKRGWEQAVDSNAAVDQVRGNRVRLTIDGGGSNSNNDYLPKDTTALWDTVNNKIIASEVGLGFSVRVQFTADPLAIADDQFDVEFDIGPDGSPVVISTRTIGAPKGSDPFAASIAIPLFALETFVANGCKVYINTTASGNDFDISNAAILIQQTFSNGTV